MASIRVLTWNLWWRFGDWRRRLAAIQRVVQDVGPDICCFQEVWSTESEDASTEIGRACDLPYSERSYTDQPERWQQWINQPGVDYGNAIVSRWPIARSAVFRLTGQHGRTALGVEVNSPAGPVPVVCTHLSAHPAASAERCDQVRELVKFVVDLGQGDFPPVVAGDLNAEPDSDEVRLLGGYKTAPVVPGMFLSDAWRYVDDEDPGWTWRRDNPHVPATYRHNARIDYLHVGKAGPHGEGTVRGLRLAGDHDVGGIWPSDHVAVVVDLAMREPC